MRDVDMALEKQTIPLSVLPCSRQDGSARVSVNGFTKGFLNANKSLSVS